MDTSEGYQRGGPRGYNRDYDNRRQDNYNRGGGRGGYYHDDRNFNYREGGRGGRGGGGRGGWQQQGNYRQQYNDFQQGGGGRGGGGQRGRYNNWGRGGQRSNQWIREKHGREEEQPATLPPDVVAAGDLTGHTRRVTCILYDDASQQIYTGSHDGSVRTWSAVNGQCLANVDVGGEVDSLLLGGGFLFVGVQKGEEGIIKVWNMATGANHLLTGHRGSVTSLVIANNSLVSSGQDKTIRVWNFNQQAGIFMSQAIITKEEGGHESSVLKLCVLNNFMFSTDTVGNVVAWDLSTGKAVQRIQKAHDGHPIVQMLPFGAYLVTAGMDGRVKVWQMNDPPLPAQVLLPSPVAMFDKYNREEEVTSPPQQQQFRGGRRPRRDETDCPGIVAMEGVTDSQGNPALMVYYNGESCVRLYSLPEFTVRGGVLTPAAETRALGCVPGNIMMTGSQEGGIKVFQWRPSEAAGGAGMQ